MLSIGYIRAETIESSMKVLNETIAKACEEIPGITPEESAARLTAGDSLRILDVRTEDEYEQRRLRGAAWVPRGKLEFEAAFGKIGGTGDHYVLYCRKDPRSVLAAKTLHDLGFNDVTYLTGGFEAWARAGFGVFNKHGELKIKKFEEPEKPADSGKISK